MATKTQIIKNETVNIPEYARPYYEDLLQRGQAESYRPYIPYGYTQDPKTGEVVKQKEAEKQEKKAQKEDAKQEKKAQKDAATMKKRLEQQEKKEKQKNNKTRKTMAK